MTRPAGQNRWPHLSATLVLIAALTLAACAPAGTPTTLATTLTTAPPATTTSSATPTTAAAAAEEEAIEIATLFLKAYGAYDADRAASYLAPDALADFGGSVETFRLDVKHGEAQGFKLLLDPCEELATSSSGTVVRCPYAYHGIRSDEIGLGPYSDNYYDLTVLDGKIVSISNHIAFMTNGFSDQMWEPFAEWVAQNYPEDGAIMYENWPAIFMQQFTEEASELWEQRSREYVEVIRSS